MTGHKLIISVIMYSSTTILLLVSSAQLCGLGIDIVMSFLHS